MACFLLITASLIHAFTVTINNSDFFCWELQPLPETVGLVEDIVVEYVTDIVSTFRCIFYVVCENPFSSLLVLDWARTGQR